MTNNPRQNPKGRLPDWRMTFRWRWPRATLPGHELAPADLASNRLCQMGGAGMHGGASTGPRTPEALRRIVEAPRCMAEYGAEMREPRRLMRLLDEEQRRQLELVK